jgi:hypothetical protein
MDIARNKGEELGKPAAFKCWICGKEGHRKEECPDFDPDYKSKRTGEKKARFGMIRQAGYNNSISLFCGEFHLLPKDGYRPQLTSIKEDLVQFDTGAEDSNYCSEELAKDKKSGRIRVHKNRFKTFSKVSGRNYKSESNPRDRSQNCA